MISKAKWDYCDDDGDREVDEEVDDYDEFDVDDDGLFLMYLIRISHEPGHHLRLCGGWLRHGPWPIGQQGAVWLMG